MNRRGLLSLSPSSYTENGRKVLLLALFFGLWFAAPSAAQEGCDPAAISDRMDALIATYLTARTQDALQAALDLQASIEELTQRCTPVPTDKVVAETTVAATAALAATPTPTAAATSVPQATPTAAAHSEEVSAVYPVGEVGNTGQGFSVRVTGLVRPANDVIENQSPFNPEPGSGEEYAVVVVNVECSAMCDVDYFDFALTGDSGIVYSGARVYYEGRLNVRGVGGSGDLPFLIRADETNLRLLYLADRLNDVVVAYEVGEPRGALTVESTTEAVTATPEGAIEVIASTNLNIREGPGTQYRVAASVRAQTPLIAYGRSEDSTWLRVMQGWVFASLVTTEADVESLPVMDN